MSKEISIDSYPDINWSREFQNADGDPDDTFGLTAVRIGLNGWRMDQSHLLIPYSVSEAKDSVLIFGYPGRARIWAYSYEERLFDLEDAERINQVFTLSQKLSVAINQKRTAEKVIDAGRKLLQDVRSVAHLEDPDIIRNSGMIEEFVMSQEMRLLPDNILLASKGLVDVGIKQVDFLTSFSNMRVGPRGSYWPDWLIRQYSQTEQSADNQTTHGRI